MILAPKQRIDWNNVKDRLRIAQAALEQSSTVDETRMRQVFRDRAVSLSRGRAHCQSTSDARSVLVFKCGEETYGIELRYIAQVFPDSHITPVPGSVETLLGVASLQGEVRSVLGLRQLLELPESDVETSRYILLLQQDGRKIGLCVEQVEDVRQVDISALIDHQEEQANRRGRYVEGMTRDKLFVLRAERLFER